MLVKNDNVEWREKYLLNSILIVLENVQLVFVSEKNLGPVGSQGFSRHRNDGTALSQPTIQSIGELVEDLWSGYFL